MESLWYVDLNKSFRIWRQYASLSRVAVKLSFDFARYPTNTSVSTRIVLERYHSVVNRDVGYYVSMIQEEAMSKDDFFWETIKNVEALLQRDRRSKIR